MKKAIFSVIVNHRAAPTYTVEYRASNGERPTVRTYTLDTIPETVSRFRATCNTREKIGPHTWACYNK